MRSLCIKQPPQISFKITENQNWLKLIPKFSHVPFMRKFTPFRVAASGRKECLTTSDSSVHPRNICQSQLCSLEDNQVLTITKE